MMHKHLRPVHTMMDGLIGWSLTMLIVLSTVTDAPAEIVLASEGRSDYTIVFPARATEHDVHAAAALQKYLERISGAQLATATASLAPARKRVFVGRASRHPELIDPADAQALGDDGLWIRTVGEDVQLLGGAEMGPLYAVYTFLEAYLGCRKYSEKVEHVPTMRTIRLGDIDDRQVPRVVFRSMSYYDARDADFRGWHKLDQVSRSTWGMWVHTFRRLIPPERYYDEHPEYFALVEGKRARDGQLALTNDEVFRVVVENLRAMMAENPGAKYWSVSQNDTFQNCQSPEARAINQREETEMGELLTFVNRVAAEFPDKVISTLAYQYSRKPPRTLRPAQNVNIVLCSIECNRSRPLAEDPLNASFREDLRGWCEIADDILVWDYCIQFSNLISPFPNLRVLGPNMRYFVDSGVTKFFKQGNREVHGEFDHLRAYILAKLLWNPQADVEAIIDDFVHGYYGPAGKHIRAYIDVMHDALEASGQELSIYGDPIKPMFGGYLRPELMEQYARLFDQAQAAVADDPELLERVLVARLPLRYATIEQAIHGGSGEAGVFRRDESGRWEAREEIVEEVEKFVAGCRALGVRRLKEWRLSPDEYEEEFERFVARGVHEHKAFGKRVRYIDHAPSAKYHAGGDLALVDGILGGSGFNINWLGFDGTDMAAVVDLESPQEVSRVTVRGIQDLQEYIFLPRGMEVQISVDGRSYRSVGSVKNDAPPLEGALLSEAFTVEFPPEKARYVKVIVEGMKTCPPGHIGAGRPAWLFVDEIVVE